MLCPGTGSSPGLRAGRDVCPSHLSYMTPATSHHILRKGPQDPQDHDPRMQQCSGPAATLRRTKLHAEAADVAQPMHKRSACKKRGKLMMLPVPTALQLCAIPHLEPTLYEGPQENPPTH